MKTLTVYTLAELKEKNPAAFAKVHERWRTGIEDVAWSEETMASLRAVVDACGGTLLDWSIGAHSPCSLRVSVEDTFIEDGEDGGDGEESQKCTGWLYANVLKPLGYLIGPDGKVSFPGLCPFTGYCADETFMEAVYKALESGETLTEALEGLADVAGRMMEDDLEQQQDEETMMMNWGDAFFTLEGVKV